MSNGRHSKRVVSDNDTVKLILLKDFRLKTRGEVTGQEYIFSGAGAVVEINKYDAEIMLRKEQNKSCCGTISSPVFQLYSEV